MRTARIILPIAFAIGINMSAALAQQASEGMITMIDRLSGTVSILRTPGGTVGTNAAAGAEAFKVSDTALLENVHAGDRVTFSLSESGGTKTITKLERQKP